MRTTEAASAARRAQGEESRERLIEVASGLIAERGYAATSVGEICRKAGVAKTALYWHFENKEGLLAAILESVGGQWIEKLQKRAYLEADALARMNGLIDDWRTLMTEQPQLIRLPLFLQLEVSRDSSAKIRTALRKIFRHAEASIAAGIEDSFGRGRIEEVEATAHTVFSLMQSAVSRSALADNKAETDQIFAELRRTIMLVVWSRIRDDDQREMIAAAANLAKYMRWP